MRLFISINVPQELHRYCKQLQSRFPDMKNTDEFHMTVQFLGDDAENPDQLIEALKNVQFTPFEIEMGDAIPFPNPFDPRGVWIECKMLPKLQKLAEDIRQTTSELGYIADKPFKAHITLGRYRRPPRQKIQKINGDRHKFIVDQFHLVESTLTPTGPKHKILASFPV
jgi:2'-5' RNA ligase